MAAATKKKPVRQLTQEECEQILADHEARTEADRAAGKAPRGLVRVPLPEHILNFDGIASLAINGDAHAVTWSFAPTPQGEIATYGDVTCPGCGWLVTCEGAPAAYCAMCGHELDPRKQVAVARRKV